MPGKGRLAGVTLVRLSIVKAGFSSQGFVFSIRLAWFLVNVSVDTTILCTHSRSNGTSCVVVNQTLPPASVKQTPYFSEILFKFTHIL